MANKIVQLKDGNDTVYPEDSPWTRIGAITVTATGDYAIDLSAYSEIHYEVNGGDSYSGSLHTVPKVALPRQISEWVNATTATASYCGFYAGRLSESNLHIERLTLYSWGNMTFTFWGKR